MSGMNNLSPNQFRIDSATSAQGNPDELVQHRGVQRMTAAQNPLPFTYDYMTHVPNPSTARAATEGLGEGW